MKWCVIQGFSHQIEPSSALTHDAPHTTRSTKRLFQAPITSNSASLRASYTQRETEEMRDLTKYRFSLPDSLLTELKSEAQKRYHGKKGAISKALNEGIRLWLATPSKPHKSKQAQSHQQHEDPPRATLATTEVTTPHVEVDPIRMITLTDLTDLKPFLQEPLKTEYLDWVEEYINPDAGEVPVMPSDMEESLRESIRRYLASKQTVEN